jgi:hypothetical protein
MPPIAEGDKSDGDSPGDRFERKLLLLIPTDRKPPKEGGVLW